MGPDAVLLVDAIRLQLVVEGEGLSEDAFLTEPNDVRLVVEVEGLREDAFLTETDAERLVVESEGLSKDACVVIISTRTWLFSSTAPFSML